MKRSKLLDRLNTLIDTATAADKEHLKKLRKVVKKLKDKQKALEKDLKDTKDKEDRHTIKRRIEILKAQRKRGCSTYQDLKAQARPPATETATKPETEAGSEAAPEGKTTAG